MSAMATDTRSVDTRSVVVEHEMPYALAKIWRALTQLRRIAKRRRFFAKLQEVLPRIDLDGMPSPFVRNRCAVGHESEISQ